LAMLVMLSQVLLLAECKSACMRHTWPFAQGKSTSFRTQGERDPLCEAGVGVNSQVRSNVCAVESLLLASKGVGGLSQSPNGDQVPPDVCSGGSSGTLKCRLRDPFGMRQRTRVAHVWAWASHLKRFQCSICAQSSRRAHDGPCLEAAIHTRKHSHVVDRAHPSHVLFELDDGAGNVLWFCNACGKYTQALVRGLAARCTPLLPRSPPWYGLERMRGGSHPFSKGVSWGQPRKAAAGNGLHGFVQGARAAPKAPLAPRAGLEPAGVMVGNP